MSTTFRFSLPPGSRSPKTRLKIDWRSRNWCVNKVCLIYQTTDPMTLSSPLHPYRGTHSQIDDQKSAWWPESQRKGPKWIVTTADGERSYTAVLTQTGIAWSMESEFQSPWASSVGGWVLLGFAPVIFLLEHCQPLPSIHSLEIGIYSQRLLSGFTNTVSGLFYPFRSRFVLIYCFSFLIFKGISLLSSSST